MIVCITSIQPIRKLQWFITFQLLCIGIMISILLYQEKNSLNTDCSSVLIRESPVGVLNSSESAGQAPVLVLFSPSGWQCGDYFHDILEVFNRIGYRKGKRAEKPRDWDVLWVQKYPAFQTAVERGKSFWPYQRVNHFPGIAAIVSKSTLLKEGGKFIPTAFVMPEDKDAFLNEVQKSPNETRAWIQKATTHQGWQVKDVPDLDLNSFVIVQEFVQNPFLIDGYKLNIGIYVIITSIDPLRAFIFDTDAGNRLCQKKYVFGNYTDLLTYVPDIEPPQRLYHLPSLERICTKLNFNFFDAMKTYILSKGKDPSVLREQIYAAVRDTLITRVARMRETFPASLFRNRSNLCFEFMRWDFLLDEDLKLHLIEVNMSPNMKAYPTNKTEIAHKQQVLFNSYSISGIGDIRKHGAESSVFNSIRDSDINAGIAVCSKSKCIGCKAKDCFMCTHCMSKEAKHMIRVAYAEQFNRKHYRRVYPEKMSQTEAMNYNPKADEGLSISDQITRAWFRAKCIGDPYWCE